jgi:hypothetical protein
MPDREVMWPAVQQMVERFVLAEPDRTSSQGEVE